MSGTLARSDREAKEAAERRAQLAEARVREVEERLDRALAAITEARAEGGRLREALRGLLLSADCAWEERHGGHDWPEAVAAARAALVSPSPRPAENEGNAAKETT
jgi:hypothetical protein